MGVGQPLENRLKVHVERWGVKGAGIGGRTAVQAPLRRSGRCIFRGKMAQPATGTEGLDRAVENPVQDIEIMAGFCQDHRTGDVLATPVATNEAVRHVPGGDIFPVGDGNDLPQVAAVDDLVDLLEEIGYSATHGRSGVNGRASRLHAPVRCSPQGGGPWVFPGGHHTPIAALSARAGCGIGPG